MSEAIVSLLREMPLHHLALVTMNFFSVDSFHTQMIAVQCHTIYCFIHCHSPIANFETNNVNKEEKENNIQHLKYAQ